MNALSGFIMEFGEFETSGGKLETSNGAWFVTPDKRQSMAGASKRILLMQLTTEGEINGLINLHGRTKAVMKNDVLESGGEQIKAEGIVFPYTAPLTVKRLEPGSAERAGVRAGWVVKSVNGQSLEGLDYNCAIEVVEAAVLPLPRMSKLPPAPLQKS